MTIQHGKKPSHPAILPAEYAQGDYVELTNLPPSRSTSTDSLPAYDTIATSSSPSLSNGLTPTHTYQIKAAGHPLVALPFALRPDPIGIFSVSPTGEKTLVYQSVRASRCSGNSLLISADDALTEKPLAATTYRFGPGRPPRITLQGEVSCPEEFQVQGKGIHTRAQRIRTHLGNFQWRYGSRSERRDTGASSLLLLEQVTSVARLGGKQEERRRRVAQLVRNEEVRTRGTKGCTAGNGGRLVVDLGEWTGKGEGRQMEVLVVSSCLVMLKKEVDRRRAAQFMILAGSSGGP